MIKIDNLKMFLQKEFPNIQAFNTRNNAGDNMETVYEKNGIMVDYCEYWKYIEIFGLTEKQFYNLLDEDSGFGHLRTFKFNKK